MTGLLILGRLKHIYSFFHHKNLSQPRKIRIYFITKAQRIIMRTRPSPPLIAIPYNDRRQGYSLICVLLDKFTKPEIQ